MANLFFNEDFLFDSHCHLNDKQFDDDREACVQRALDAGVAVTIDVGVDVATSEAAVEMATRFQGSVYAAVGIDPDALVPGSDIYAKDFDMQLQMDIIRRLVSQNPSLIVGIGETGMDEYKSKAALDRQELTLAQYNEILDNQEKLFSMHLGLGEETGLPLTIHSRGAEQRCIDLVKSFPKAKGVFHSFTGTYELAKQILDAGWGLGMNGIVTFKNANDLREMYLKVLGEVAPDWTAGDFYRRGVYFETDAPFLAPEGRRGQRNEPAFVADVFKYLLGNV